MGSILLDENPLLISPKLAYTIGLNESIVLQQIHYWLRRSKKVIEGRVWIYNSYKKWTEQFYFWSERTVRRIIKSLELKGLIISTSIFNGRKYDKTKWYTIDYDRLMTYIREIEEVECKATSNNHTQNPGFIENISGDKDVWEDEKSDCNEWITNVEENNQREVSFNMGKYEHKKSCSDIGQCDHINRTYCPDMVDKLDEPIPKNTTEITSKFKNNENSGFREVYRFYLDNINPIPSNMEREELIDLIDTFNGKHEIVIEAIRIATMNNARKISYIRKALLDWKERGINNLEEVKSYISERSKRNGSNFKHTSDTSKNTPKEYGIKLPELKWDEGEYEDLELI